MEIRYYYTRVKSRKSLRLGYSAWLTSRGPGTSQAFTLRSTDSQATTAVLHLASQRSSKLTLSSPRPTEVHHTLSEQRGNQEFPHPAATDVSLGVTLIQIATPLSPPSDGTAKRGSCFIIQGGGHPNVLLRCRGAGARDTRVDRAKQSDKPRQQRPFA